MRHRLPETSRRCAPSSRGTCPSCTRRAGRQLEPLLYACYSRMDGTRTDWSTLEVARLLLAHGADPNAGFSVGRELCVHRADRCVGEGEDNMNQLPHPHCSGAGHAAARRRADPNDAQTLYNRHFKESDDHLKLLLSYGLGQGSGGPWYTRMPEQSADAVTAATEEWPCGREPPSEVSGSWSSTASM